MSRSTLALYSLGYSYSFESDAMLDVWVILDLWFMALVGNVLMDSVSFGYIFVRLTSSYVTLMQLPTAVCSPIIVFNLVCGAVFMCFSSWWQLKEKIIVICSLVNMVMAGIDCPLGSCLEKSLFLILFFMYRVNQMNICGWYCKDFPPGYSSGLSLVQWLWLSGFTRCYLSRNL